MTDFIKKWCAYFAGTVVFLVTIKATFSIPTPWPLMAAVVASVGIACASVAWLEVWGIDWRLFPKRRADSDEASLSLSLKKAQGSVRCASKDDESIALEVNKIVRRGLDKPCISYEDYRNWRRKNPTIFSAVVSSDGQLLGFFDIFPLTDQAAAGLRQGRLHEHELTIDDIVPYEQNEGAENIYIASIMANPRQQVYGQVLAREVAILKCIEYLLATFPPSATRTIFAYAYTEMGERLLKNAGFTNTALPKESKLRSALYEMKANSYLQLARTFEATSGIRVTRPS